MLVSLELAPDLGEVRVVGLPPTWRRNRIRSRADFRRLLFRRRIQDVGAWQWAKGCVILTRVSFERASGVGISETTPPEKSSRQNEDDARDLHQRNPVVK